MSLRALINECTEDAQEALVKARCKKNGGKLVLISRRRAQTDGDDVQSHTVSWHIKGLPANLIITRGKKSFLAIRHEDDTEEMRLIVGRGAPTANRSIVLEGTVALRALFNNDNGHKGRMYALASYLRDRATDYRPDGGYELVFCAYDCLTDNSKQMSNIPPPQRHSACRNLVDSSVPHRRPPIFYTDDAHCMNVVYVPHMLMAQGQVYKDVPPALYGIECDGLMLFPRYGRHDDNVRIIVEKYEDFDKILHQR